MDTAKKIVKKQRKEEQRIGRRSKEIIALISEAFRRDPGHAFNRMGLLQDEKSEYTQEDYEALARPSTEKVQRIQYAVQNAGAGTMARVMRNYCEVLMDSTKTEREGTEAMMNAVHLLLILAQIGKKDTEQLNQTLVDSCTRDVSMKALDDIVVRQWEDRQKYYTPELRAQMLKDLKVRTIA